MISQKTLFLFVSLNALMASCGLKEQDVEKSTAAEKTPKTEKSETDRVEKIADKKPVLSLQSLAQDPVKESEELKTNEDSALGSSKENYFCRTGFAYDSKNMLCASETKASGPFPLKMQDLCKRTPFAKEVCEANEWSKDLAIRFRGTDDCSYGTIWDTARKVCVEGENAFGPFSTSQVDSCKKSGAGLACETNRWHKSLIRGRSEPQIILSETGRKLVDYYSVFANYTRVSDQVKVFYPPHVKNGCVAFMSEALRQSGYFIPKDQIRDGYNVSLVTPGFYAYLKEKNWKKINQSDLLQPGDIVFTLPEDSWPGVSAHTYLFQRWSNKADGIGIVIDNQGFSHNRNIYGYGTHNFTPFWYAMRAP
jgi:hypothetical protein